MRRRAGKDASLATPLADLWEDFWAAASVHPELVLLYTAAGARAGEAAADSAIVQGINRVDAVSTVVLKRLVTIGLDVAERARTPIVLSPIPRLDVKALVESSDHNLLKCEAGYRCSRCNLTLSRTDLRKGGQCFLRPAGRSVSWS